MPPAQAATGHSLSHAWRIRTPRLVLRCWEPDDDAPGLVQAIEVNRDHLRPWMDWVDQEPQTLDAVRERLGIFHERFRLGQDFTFGIFDPDEQTVLGGAGLHPRIGAGAAEIGYWIHVDRLRQGLATEAAGALTRVAFECAALRVVEIHCDPRNLASAAIPHRLGYRHQVTVAGCALGPSSRPRDMMVWSMRPPAYRRSSAAAMPVEVTRRTGQRIL